MSRIKLDDSPKKIWNLNQLKINECFVGIPKAEYYKNKKGNQFIKLLLDTGYSTLNIYLLIFDFPEQKILNSKYHNSFELVRFYREANNIPVDDNISQLHDINWLSVIDFLNEKETIKIKCINKNINGFKNILFLE